MTVLSLAFRLSIPVGADGNSLRVALISNLALGCGTSARGVILRLSP